MDLNHTWWRLGWPSSSFVQMLHGNGIVRQCHTNSFKPNADRCSSFMGARKMSSNFCKWSHVGIAFSKQKRNPISRNSFSRNHGSGNWPLWRLNHPFSTSWLWEKDYRPKNPTFCWCKFVQDRGCDISLRIPHLLLGSLVWTFMEQAGSKFA